MGSSQHASQLAEFNIDHCSGSLSLISRKATSQKLLMKTYISAGKEELVSKLRYFKGYRQNMEGNQQVSRLMHIIQEKDQYFCSTSHRLHLIFEHSEVTIAQQIRERRQAMHRDANTNLDSAKYFNYEDICNILYSCLSALWFSQQLLPQCPDQELARFGTIFLSTNQMLIFGEGVLKIMDPFVADFRPRYSQHPNVYYSPQKLSNFAMIDDQKCAVFELGMSLLEIALLQPLKEAYHGREYREEVTAKKLERAKQIYSSDIENSMTVSAFDLVQKMLEVEREQRFTLQQAISYAEQMYEVQESLAQSASPSRPARFYPASGSQHKKGVSQNRTANSSPKLSSTSRFYDFRNSTLCDRGDNSLGATLRSPRITNFTIEQARPEQEEQSSMLESLTVENFRPGISESVVEGGIFSSINITNSYNYGLHPKFNATPREERVFTDPELLRTINRQLREIEERKRQRSRDDSMFSSGSRVIQRRQRYECKQVDSSFKISNKAYLQ